MKSNEQALELGLYVSDCCDAELIYFQGDHFGRCPSCHHLCRWELQEELVTVLDLVSGGNWAA